jgi:transcription termination/antitermination protein NusG
MRSQIASGWNLQTGMTGNWFFSRKPRGEALTEPMDDMTGSNMTAADPSHGAMVDSPQWYVLWTRSNCETAVHDQLAEKGYEVFLPTVNKWSRHAGDRQLRHIPMFRGYLFVYRSMDKMAYIDISKSKGLVKILGGRWDRLAAVPESEIESIRKVTESELPRMPHPYLREGEPVRIVRGPLANVEGILVKSDCRKGLLVLSIDLLHQSVAVEIDCTLVAAA